MGSGTTAAEENQPNWYGVWQVTENNDDEVENEYQVVDMLRSSGDSFKENKTAWSWKMSRLGQTKYSEDSSKFTAQDRTD